ncbi:MAG: SDR family NAD(P)-dependent oxidoreductase, partial [Myxococcota bacterium]
SGGVGLAAVAHAQRIGAQIFATAGNPEKRAYLESLGIEHVMDSRSTEFAEQILKLTRGAGVDVLLNCLSGDAIEKNFEVLAPYGRYLEIGIRDIYENTKIGLRPFHKNLSYHAIELGPMTAQRPELMRELLVNALRGQSEGVFEALPLTEFPVAEAGEALRFMAQARHIGKVILSLEDQEVEVDPPADGSMTFRENATYLITGGLGGLGLYLSRFMIECGARHLVLTSRSGTDRPVQKEAVEELRRLGAEVVVARADAADELEMTRVFKEMGESMPPLRGVVHCAVVLDDGLLLSQTRESFHRVMAPKVLGAWNLHRLTEDMALDFFALFSSTGALMGSVGQGNYTAANAFLDALANHRRAVGLPGLSINWGPWAEVGGAALLGADDRNAAAGIDSISPEWGAAGFTELLRGTAAQVGFLGLDVQKFFDVHPALLGMPFYEELAGERVGTGRITRAAPVRKKLLAIDSGVERARALRSYLRQQIGSTLRIDPDMIESDKQI